MKNPFDLKQPNVLLRNALLLAMCGAVQIETQAALPTDAILNFNPGVTTVTGCLLGTAPPPCLNTIFDITDIAGSYFAIDGDGDGTFMANEKTAIGKNEGVRIGDIQPASGSHAGSPDGTELPSIDMPWSFFANTGMHQTITPVITVNGDDGAGDNTASLDFSGWGLTWAGIPNIPLGGDSANFPSDTGVAVLNCSSSCGIGDTFSLDYFAHVPLGDPSGFGGVPYTVHLTGVIDPGSPIPPTKSVAIQLTGGSSHECTSFDGDVIEATANIITTDINDIASVYWELDGANAGSGNSIDVLTPLGSHTLSVFVDTLASGSFQSSEPVAVNDSTPPELNIHFIDQRDGLEITEVTSDGNHFVTVRYDVADICDPEPTTSGVAVPVHAVDNGDTIKIEKKQITKSTLGTSAVNVSAEAADATGNRRQRGATLLIVD